MTALDRAPTADEVDRTSPFGKHPYGVPYTLQATRVERKVDDLGRTVWEFTAGSDCIRVHSLYDKKAAESMPAWIINLLPQARVDCEINVFWQWVQATGNMRFDAKRAIDVKQRNSTEPGQILQHQRKRTRENASRAALSWMEDHPRENDCLLTDPTLLPFDFQYITTLEAWFPREDNTVADQTLEDELTKTADEQAAQDKPKAANDWITDDGKRGRFFGAINGLCDTYKISEQQRDEIIAELAGGKLHAYAGTASALIKGFKEAAEKIAQNAPILHDQADNRIDTPVPHVQSNGDVPASVETANVIPFPQAAISLPRTITGISVLDIGKELNKHLPPEAYDAIKFGQMSGKTDIDGDAVRDRFDKVYGCGMWRIVPHQLAGRVEYSTEQRTSSKGLEQTWHICTLVAHQFQYALIMPDGSFQWIDGMVTSDLHDNLDQQYSYRGAVTSIMKQFYRLMGGMNHIIYNEYTHEHAAREIAARNRRNAA